MPLTCPPDAPVLPAAGPAAPDTGPGVSLTPTPCSLLVRPAGEGECGSAAPFLGPAGSHTLRQSPDSPGPFRPPPSPP